MVCGEVISSLMNEFRPPRKDWEEYGLYFFLDSKTNFWLDETEKLVKYDLYHKQVDSFLVYSNATFCNTFPKGVLQFKIKPMAIQVGFMGAKAVIELDSDADVNRFLKVATAQFDIPKDKVHDYGLTLGDEDIHFSPNTQQRKWLDKDKKVSECGITKTVLRSVAFCN
jgi:hypothetical protein